MTVETSNFVDILSDSSVDLHVQSSHLGTQMSTQPPGRDTVVASTVPENQILPSLSQECSVASVRRNESILLASPARKRSRAVIANLSSSSLKKRTTKSSHCKFCPRYKCRSSLEEHLKLSDTCLQLYCREFKVRSLDAVLIKCFSCLGCDKIGKFKLAVHLSKSESCLRVYRERFGVEDVRFVKLIGFQVAH